MKMNLDKLQQSDEKKPISIDDLTFQIDLKGIDLTLRDGEEDFAGQKRAASALEMGINVGYNIFVSGISGSEDLNALNRWLKKRAKDKEIPGDIVYVQNFKDEDKPHAIDLKQGDGSRLRQMMHDLIHSLKRELPEAFRNEAFTREKEFLKDKYGKRSEFLNKTYETLAKEKGFQVQTSPDGQIFFIPLLEGKPIEKPEEFSRLSEEEREGISKKQEELGRELEKLFSSQREILRDLETDIRKVERTFCEKILSPLVQDIKNKIQGDRISEYLDEMKEHILDHLDLFKEQSQAKQLKAGVQEMLEYEVNVAVDNSETAGAPVIMESSPGYINLFGNIERVVDRFGRVVTNFTRIKSGSLLRANGGYLILNLGDALSEPAVWKTLKRTLKNKRIEMETYEPYSIFSASGLKPEPVSINTKVIVYGSHELFNILFYLDEDFKDVFKSSADFSSTMKKEKDNLSAFVKWINQTVEEKNLLSFDESALKRIVEFGSRWSENRDKLTASREVLFDLIVESVYQAKKADVKFVTEKHIDDALQLRKFHNNRMEEELLEMTKNDVLLLDVKGKKIGQINALAVIDLGGYQFGRPSRITASVGMGQAGIVNIEREAKMSGKIHDKGVLILSGYLRYRFGRNIPLNLSVSISFEQSYSGIDGDSASSTELYVILSALTGIPLRQDIAVTGSVNQHGEVQAIGGVNEKIEGFFKTCRAAGLTGTQGVMIPASNTNHLILDREVLDAVREGNFHIYSVRTIDEGLEILTGIKAGEPDEENTVNGLAARSLRELASSLKEFNSDQKKSSEVEN